MSSVVSTHEARVFLHASDIPDDVWRALSETEAAANVILPFARKARNFPREDNKEQLWIALYDGTNNVEFVLSCTKGPLGNYPIFIVACKALSDEYLTDSLRPLVRRLLDEVPPKRIFSVFSIARVTERFAEIFVAEAHARGANEVFAIAEPYYDATFTFCTPDTFNQSLDSTFPSRDSEQVAIRLCRADMSHLDGVKVLCKAFSETSPPYVLDDACAELEATTMIANKQAYVHMIKRGNEEWEIACLVATTRESDNVVVVTKVFTAERWRGFGCARRLLHCIFDEIYEKKERVVVYIENSEALAPTRKVYRKIGFQGLEEPRVRQVEGVERWLEIGFEGTELGYW